MPRRNRHNQTGTIYLSLTIIAIAAIVVIYLGFVKNPTEKIERHTEKIIIELDI